MAALGRVTSKVINQRPSGNLTYLSSAISSDSSASSSLSSAGDAANDFEIDMRFQFQSILLEPFIDLFRSKHDDTKLNIIRAVFSILQSSGQCIRGAWLVLLNLLSQVTNCLEEAVSITFAPRALPTNGKLLIIEAFKCLELIMTDFLSQIPVCNLAELIQTITYFCAQRHDTNISFSSIGLLWRISDHIALTRQRSVDALERQKQLHLSLHGENCPLDERLLLASGSLQAEIGSIMTETKSTTLARTLNEQFIRLSRDSRTEVRNSAIKTMYSSLNAFLNLPCMLSDSLLAFKTIVLPFIAELFSAEVHYFLSSH